MVEPIETAKGHHTGAATAQSSGVASSVFNLEALAADAQLLRDRFKGANFSSGICIVEGTGWNNLFRSGEIMGEVPFGELESYVKHGVGGNSQSVKWVRLGDRDNLVLGRNFAYQLEPKDGLTPLLATPYFAKKLGSPIFLTAAGVGGITCPPNSYAVITSHVGTDNFNLFPGPPLPIFQSEFARAADAYDQKLSDELHRIISESCANVCMATYRFWSSKTFQTHPEIRREKILHGLAEEGLSPEQRTELIIGKSCFPDAVYAHQLGLRAAALGLVTNWAAGMDPKGIGPDHKLHLDVGNEMALTSRKILSEAIERLPQLL